MRRYILCVYPCKPSPYAPLVFFFYNLLVILSLVDSLDINNVHWAVYDSCERLVARSSLV